MVKQLLIATGNKHKAREVADILGAEWQIKTLSDYPELNLPPEDGDTFAANAVIKAVYAAQEIGVITLADDSGLVVQALDGAPGVYSARYAGDDKDDAANNAKLLQEMKDVPDGERQAYFACAIAVALPDGTVHIFEGRMDGEILREPLGTGGFGYDPLVYLPQVGKSVAELSMEEKNKFSHRSLALRQAVPILQKIVK